MNWKYCNYMNQYVNLERFEIIRYSLYTFGDGSKSHTIKATPRLDEVSRDAEREDYEIELFSGKSKKQCLDWLHEFMK